MTTKDYLSSLRNDIHTTVVATVDAEGHPVTRVIDIMLADDTTFYFLTAQGKQFYDQLMDQKYLSLSGMTGGEGMDIKEATMHMKAISARGEVECIGKEKLDEIFEKNPYMAEIYPSEDSRAALVVFKMTKGDGEYFDLSTKPITRGNFKIGEGAGTEETKPKARYLITDACVGCGNCVVRCPQNCIEFRPVPPFVIKQENCLHCGNCYTVCPYEAITKD